MMIDMDELIPVRDIPAEIRRITGGRTKPDKCTVYRWLKVGNRGAKLRRVYIGKIALVKRQWIADFIADTEPQLETIEKPEKPEQAVRRNQDGTLPTWRKRQLDDVRQRAKQLGLA